MAIGAAGAGSQAVSTLMDSAINKKRDIVFKAFLLKSSDW
jgi:hypothetical protein